MRSSLYCQVGKRLIDLGLAIPLSVLLMPLMVIIALLVRLKFGSPILFRQQRTGLHSKPFIVLKFRTMTEKRDENNQLLPDAERLTHLGLFLRNTSLDELPELFNVLKGEMSLVGPRPFMAHYLSRYSPEQARRHEVKPGITGWAQVNGRNTLSWEERFKMDGWYVDHLSFKLDLQILLMTLAKVTKREGISAENHVTMLEFFGSQVTEHEQRR